MNLAETADEPVLPLLVVDEVERDKTNPTRLTAMLRFAGHRVRIVLDFAQRDLGLIEHVELPRLLGAHAPSQRAVIRLLEHIYDGEAVALPHDLSDAVRDAEPPFPLRPLDAARRARLEAAAAEVPLQVDSVHRSGSYPAHISAQLVLDGRPLAMEVELFDEAGAVPVMRWITGPDPATLTEAQLYAIQLALTRPTGSPR